jgi:hypothetical protein
MNEQKGFETVTRLTRRRRELRGPEFFASRTADDAARMIRALFPNFPMQRQGDLHRYRTSASGIFDPQSRRRPPSPTPASSPTASPHLRDVAGLTIGSSKVRSVSAPSYFTSSLRPSASPGPSFSRQPLPSLPSSPCCPPSPVELAVSHQYPRESWALHFDYYSKTKKTASGLTKRVSARRSRIAARRDDTPRRCRRPDCRARARAPRALSGRFKKPL